MFIRMAHIEGQRQCRGWKVYLRQNHGYSSNCAKKYKRQSSIIPFFVSDVKTNGNENNVWNIWGWEHFGSESCSQTLPLKWALLCWLKLTHVFSLVVESPNAAVGKGDKNQAGRFQAKNQLMVQIVKHNRLRSKSLDHQGLRILMSTSSSLFFKGRLNNVKNIARGTTDPGYGLSNLSYLSS